MSVSSQLSNFLTKASSKVLFNTLTKQNFVRTNRSLFLKATPICASNQQQELKMNNNDDSTSSTIVPSILKLGRLNHVAIATSDLEKATAMYRDLLGANVSEPQDLPAHGVTTVFVDLGNTKIELLRPFGEKSPIQKFLDKNKDGGIHHVCVEVKSITEAVESIKAGGQIRILDKEPKIGAHGKLVVFLHPKDCGGVLIELEES